MLFKPTMRLKDWKKWREEQRDSYKAFKRGLLKQSRWAPDPVTKMPVAPTPPITRRRTVVERALNMLQADNRKANAGRPAHEHKATSRKKLRRQLTRSIHQNNRAQ